MTLGGAILKCALHVLLRVPVAISPLVHHSNDLLKHLLFWLILFLNLTPVVCNYLLDKYLHLSAVSSSAFGELKYNYMFLYCSVVFQVPGVNIC